MPQSDKTHGVDRSYGRGPLDLVLLGDTWNWFGQHTGYDQLARGLHLQGNVPHMVRCAGEHLLKRVRSRIYGFYHGGAWCCAERESRAEGVFLATWRQHPGAVGHVLYFERHHPFFTQWSRAPARLIATIHHPPIQTQEWHRDVLEDLRRLSSAIVLYQRDLDFFRRYVGHERVKFVHHGVDTTFFKPGECQLDGPKRLLFTGVNGRNLAMVQRVIDRLIRSHPQLRFDLLLPRLRDKPRETLNLAGLWYRPQVTWHCGISDGALRTLYQKSYLLLLPLQYAGACNAIVEALASGLPIVTTDVGGVRDYGGGTIYPVVANNDDDDMVDVIDRYLSNLEWRQEVASRCRQFAEQVLSWSKVAQDHLRAYRELSD